MRRRFLSLFDKLIGPRPLPQRPPGWHELPPRPRGAAHFHVCRCGNYFACFSEYDRCPVTDPWDCPTCERAAIDAYFNAEEKKQQGGKDNGDLRK